MGNVKCLLQCTLKSVVHGVQIQVKWDPPFRRALIRPVLVDHLLRGEQLLRNCFSDTDMAATRGDEGKAGFQVIFQIYIDPTGRHSPNKIQVSILKTGSPSDLRLVGVGEGP